MKRLISAALLAVALLASPVSVVHAQEAPVVATDATGTTTITTPDAVTQVTAPEATTVVVPYGNWIDALLENVLGIVGSVVIAVMAWGGRNLPKAVLDVLRVLQAEQLLTRAAEYGINATRGAVKGKTLEVDVGNKAVATAVNYAVQNGPRWLIDWMGGEHSIKDKIIARIPLGENFGSR